MKATHMVIGGDANHFLGNGIKHDHKLWCSMVKVDVKEDGTATTEEGRTVRVTADRAKVTCKSCIRNGGCGA